MISRITISLRKNVSRSEDDWIKNDPLTLRTENLEVSTWAFGMGGRGEDYENEQDIESDISLGSLEEDISIIRLRDFPPTPPA